MSAGRAVQSTAWNAQKAAKARDGLSAIHAVRRELDAGRLWTDGLVMKFRSIALEEIR